MVILVRQEDGSSPWTGSKAQGGQLRVDQKNSSADASARVIEAGMGLSMLRPAVGQWFAVWFLLTESINCVSLRP